MPDGFDGTTSGKDEAIKALAESEASNRAVDALLADIQKSFDLVRMHRESNHFADKFRAIIQGVK